MKATLSEFERRDLPLSAASAEHLQRHFAKKVDLSPRTGGVWRLTAKHHVGTILGPDLELRIKPKCGIPNLFHLLARAYRLADLRRELVGHEEVDDLRDVLLEIVIRRVEDLLRLGLRSEYVEREDDLPALRGRLQLNTLLRRPPHATLRLPCRYEEFTADVPHNQILRYTLLTVGRAPSVALESRRRRILGALAGVSLRPFRSGEIEEFSYTRLNAHYEPLHQLCRLLLDAIGIEQEAGPTRLSSFLIDMNAVFELFVASWIKDHLPRNYRVVTQVTRHLDFANRIRIRPDLRLQHQGLDFLVADTKYKIRESSTPTSADAFQALAYCRALGLQACVLIYPREQGPSEGRFRIRGGEEVVTRMLPLNGDASEIEHGMRELVSRCLDHAASSSTTGELTFLRGSGHLGWVP